MAFISIATIVGILPDIGKRNDPKFWSVDIEEMGEPRRKGTVTAVSLETQGLKLTVTDGDKEVKLAALPYTATKTKVLVNDEVDADAALIFAYKGSPFNPSRWGFDFKRVTLGDEDFRFNFRYDP